jgi:hypothetical protein
MSTQVTTNPFFSPTQISGCQLWLDAADVNGNRTNPANGASVSTWVDKSGSGFNATVASGKVAGIYSTANNAMNFASSNTGYVTSYTANPTNETMFVVTNNSTLNVNNFIIIGGQSGARSLSVASTGNGLGSVGNLKNQIVFLASTPGGTYTAGTTVMVTSQFTTSSNSISLNGGTTISGGAPAFTAGTTTYLGVDTTTSAYYYIGLAMEIIFYNSILNTTQRQQVEGYLAWKWGLQANLPSTHPYKTSLIPPLLNPPTTLPLLRQNPVSFVPTQISGCGLWLDGADTTTLTYQSGNNVSIWTDKSAGIQAQFLTNAMAAARWTPGGNSVGSTGATNYPVSGSNINGVNALYFNQAVLQAITTQNVNTRSYFLVFQLPSNSTGPGDNILWPATWVNGFARGASLSVDSSNFTFANQNVANLLYLDVTPKNPTLVSVTFNNGTPGMWNAGGGTTTATGQSSSSLNSSGSTDNYLWIGGASGIFSSTGFILGEFLEYNSALLTSQRQQVEGYLAWKWGLQANLPTNHPYKAGPPYSATITAPSRSLGIAATWNPTLISGCQLWLDAADVNGNRTNPLNGASVSTWTDKSGNGRNASQSTSANRPSVGTVNGRTAIVFSGSPVFMTLPDITSVPLSIFILAASTQNENNTFYVSLGGNPNAVFLREQFGPAIFGIDNGSGAGSYLTSVRDLNTHIWSFTLPASVSGTFAFDGSVVATSGFTLNSNTNFVSNSIGTWNQQSANGNIKAGISEIVMYNVDLSTSQRQNVEGYLAWKWGLVSSLPANHPFKRWPPSP